ncbi:MAG: SAM-dependent methyltransferase [Hyphomicrobiaceae bacterium]|nr:SAM-dependent methyltransferase [Hyphomicrobiaceae bacterium]
MAAEQQPTPLALKLEERIRREGALPVYEYMRACLQDPEHGYYRRRPAVGAGGDFTTAPEISQVFGELIGIWAAVAWRAMGHPAHLDLVELGPGRGTMMSDALRAARVVPGFSAAVRVHLVESNVALREVQHRTLSASAPAVPIAWHDALSPALAAGPATVVLANELLDALPVRQLVFTGGTWRERSVGLDWSGRLALVPGGTADPEALPDGHPPCEGDVLESHPDFAEVADVLGQWSGHPLAALFIDYGHTRTAFGDTLQAVRQHRYASPFECPGEVDLTAHVDFAAFARECLSRGLTIDGPITQGEFLLGLGLAERSARLMASARPDQIGMLEAGVQRISDPGGMGGRFKVLCVRSAGVPVLPPFPPRPMTSKARLR